MTVTIADQGDRRVVEIVGEQRGYGSGSAVSRVATHYSRVTIEAILAAKGEMWLRDEIERGESPDYVLQPLRRQFERFRPISGLRLLDFGCGCGASTLALARLGAASVTGVEPVSQFVEVARLRACDSDLDRKVSFLHLPDTTSLPFASGEFDGVVLNAVVEHIPPRRRRVHLREIWRVLRPGGQLLIGETPNRVWPQDYHTTGLWWIPYMPLGLARRYAIARGYVPADAQIDDLLREGIRGVTYWELAEILGPSARCLNPVVGDDVLLRWERSLARPGQSDSRRFAKRRLYDLHRIVDRLVLRPLRVPAAALLPELSLCWEKDADGNR